MLLKIWTWKFNFLQLSPLIVSAVIIISTARNRDVINKNNQGFTKASVPAADKNACTIHKKPILLQMPFHEEWGWYGVYEIHLQKTTLQQGFSRTPIYILPSREEQDFVLKGTDTLDVDLSSLPAVLLLSPSSAILRNVSFPILKFHTA